MRLFLAILVSLLLTVSLFAQEVETKPINKSAINTEVHLNPVFNSKLSFVNLNTDYTKYLLMGKYTGGYSASVLGEAMMIDGSYQDFLKSQRDFKQALKYQFNFARDKTDLGTVGKMLGAAMAATAAGLAVYHVVKYNDNYSLKEVVPK